MEERQVATRNDVTPSILERLGLLSGVTAALSVVVSFFYDWGFFTALGISFNDAPTTITDHIRSWLVWLPVVGIMFIVIVAKELFTRRLEHGKTEDEIIAASPDPDRTARRRNRPYKVIAVLAPILVVQWVLLGDSFFGGFLFGLGICWFVFVAWLFSDPVMQMRHPYWFRLSFYWLLPVAVMIFSLGFISVERDGDFFPPWGSGSYTIQMERPERTKSVRVLRSFEKWLLVREDDAIVWLPVDDIRRMELQKPEPYRGLMCTIWRSLCVPSRAEVEETPESGDS